MLGPNEQREKVKKLMGMPLKNDCYMISMKWWEKWKFYVNYDGLLSMSEEERQKNYPGKLDNSDLM